MERDVMDFMKQREPKAVDSIVSQSKPDNRHASGAKHRGAIQESDDAGRGPRSGRDRAHGRRKCHRLAEHRRIQRRGDRGRAAGLINCLRDGGRGAAGEVRVPGVGDRDRVIADGQRGRRKRRDAGAQASCAQGRSAIQESDRAARRSNTRGDGTYSRRERHRLAEYRRIDR